MGGEKAGVLTALGYVLWPSSKAGYATYATIGAAGVATTVGVMKHKRAVEAVRKAKQRRNYGVAAAGGFAALAAAGYFGKQAYDYKNSGQDHEFATSSELADEAPVSGTPSGTTKASSGAQGKTKRKKGKKNRRGDPLASYRIPYRARSGCRRWRRLLLPRHERRRIRWSPAPVKWTRSKAHSVTA